MTVPKAVILRVYLVYTIVLIVMILVIVKSFSIIMDGRETIFATSDKIQQRSALITPRRGEILDANASPLVTSVAFYDVYIDPTTVKKEVWEKDISGLANGLAEIFGDRTAREYEK